MIKKSATEQMAARLIELDGNADEPGMIYYVDQNADEVAAEFGSECALFGDAGPGAEQNVIRMRQGVCDLEREAKFLREAFGLGGY